MKHPFVYYSIILVVLMAWTFNCEEQSNQTNMAKMGSLKISKFKAFLRNPKNKNLTFDSNFKLKFLSSWVRFGKRDNVDLKKLKT